MDWATASADSAFREFWQRPLTGLIATVSSDGRPHVVAVNAVLDLDTGIAEVLSRRGSVKVRNVLGGRELVALTRIDGTRWSTLRGRARILDEPALVAEAERRYARRYREPRPHPERVVIQVTVDVAMDVAMDSVLGRL